MSSARSRGRAPPFAIESGGGIGSGAERDVDLADRSADGAGLDLEKAIRTLGVSRVILARQELTFSERLGVEREYVENYSFCKDLKIMLQTVAAVGRGQVAF